MNVNRGLAQVLGLTSLAVSEAIFFFFFFVIKRIGISYRHMEKLWTWSLGRWTIFWTIFFLPFYRGGATIRTQGGVGCSPSVLREGREADHCYSGRGGRRTISTQGGVGGG